MNYEKIKVNIQDERLDIAFLINEMKSPSAGALSIFLGKIVLIIKELLKTILKGRK
jgi:hypothetical protein